MGDPGVTAAIVLAGVFGAALLWIVLFLTRKYVKRQFTELNTFLDFLHFHILKRCEHCEHEDYGREKELELLTYPQREEREATPVKAEWNGEKDEQEEGRRHASLERRDRRSRRSSRGHSPPRSMGTSTSPDSSSRILFSPRREYPPFEEHEHDALDGYPRPPAMPMPAQTPGMRPVQTRNPQMQEIHNQNMYPIQGNTISPMYGQQFQPSYAPPMPPMQRPILPAAAASVAQVEEEFDPNPPFQPETATVASSSRTYEPLPRSPRRVDMIYIADEYPPMILEAIEQQNTAFNEEMATTEDDEEEIQQIPRAYIPQAAPRAAFVLPQNFNYQPYEMIAPPAVIQNHGIRQQQGNRYAPYVEDLHERGRKLRYNADSMGGPAPSNAPS